MVKRLHILLTRLRIRWFHFRRKPTRGEGPFGNYFIKTGVYEK